MAFTPKFDDYKEQFKDFLIMERKNGILSVRMHTNGGPLVFSHAWHNAMPQAWHVIGNDPENEVMILTSTGSDWLGQWNKVDKHDKGLDYDLYYDATKLVENFIFDIDIPTIGAINGPGWQTQCALLCDITLCSENTLLIEGHFMKGAVPGDGLSLAFQGALGVKRAAYYMYTSKIIDAQTALELGLVNEVLPEEKLMERAWEVAETIMQQHRVCRRLTSQIAKRPWKRLFVEDFQAHLAQEFFSSQLVKSKGTPDITIEALRSWRKDK